MAPLSNSLEFDINRTTFGRDEEAVYVILSTFPHLSSVTVHHDLGHHLEYKSTYAIVYPILGIPFAQGVWHSIEKGKKDASSTAELVNLTLYVGEPNRQGTVGFPPPWVRREMNLRQMFYVTKCERDDMHDKLNIRHSTGLFVTGSIDGRYTRAVIKDELYKHCTTVSTDPNTNVTKPTKGT